MLKFGDAVNDFYLKLSGQKGGSSDYQDTKPIIDPDGNVISLSRYQKLVCKIFANRFPGVIE